MNGCIQRKIDALVLRSSLFQLQIIGKTKGKLTEEMDEDQQLQQEENLADGYLQPRVYILKEIGVFCFREMAN